MTEKPMTENQMLDGIKVAQATRRQIIKDLRRKDNTGREVRTLIDTLELVHKQIMLLKFNLDLRRLQS